MSGIATSATRDFQKAHATQPHLAQREALTPNRTNSRMRHGDTITRNLTNPQNSQQGASTPIKRKRIWRMSANRSCQTEQICDGYSTLFVSVDVHFFGKIVVDRSVCFRVLNCYQAVSLCAVYNVFSQL